MQLRGGMVFAIVFSILENNIAGRGVAIFYISSKEVI